MQLQGFRGLSPGGSTDTISKWMDGWKMLVTIVLITKAGKGSRKKSAFFSGPATKAFPPPRALRPP